MESMWVLKHLSPLSCNTGQFSPPENKTFFLINYGAIQGFLTLRKVVTHVKKNNIFSRVFNIANQLLQRHSPFAPLGHVDEWRTKPLSFLIQGRLSDYFLIMAAKKMKKSVSLTDSDVQTFIEAEENQNTKRKTESYLFVFHGHSRGSERKSTTERFATGLFWPCTWKISPVGKDQFSNWEFCLLKIRPIFFL